MCYNQDVENKRQESRQKENKKSLDKLERMCYNKSTKRKTKSSSKKNLGNYIKGLDKSSDMCYNINELRVATNARKEVKIMANNIRITKKNRFEDVIALVQGQEPTFGTTVEDAVDFLAHEIELLSRKSNSGERKMTDAQKQNMEYKEMIVEFLASAGEDGATCDTVRKSIPALYDYTPQKVSSLLTSLKNDGRVSVKKVKGTSTFFLN